MAVPEWRATVPNVPAIDGWQISQPWQAADETEFEEGPPRMRKRGGPAIVSWPLKLTREEFAEFAEMVRDDFEEGTSRFTMTVTRPGMAPATKYCEIVGGTYTAQPLGPYMAVSMSLRIYGYHS